jgi:hypothetical protein
LDHKASQHGAHSLKRSNRFCQQRLLAQTLEFHFLNSKTVPFYAAVARSLAMKVNFLIEYPGSAMTTDI